MQANNTPRFTIYTQNNTPRLKYVLEWIFAEQLGVRYEINTNIQFSSDSYSIYYGYFYENEFSIYKDSLLDGKSIENIDIQFEKWNSLDVLFHNESSLASIPFDIFSAIFYIISRYEEYLPHSKDKHGRYPHSESILYKNGQLHIPIVDVWVDFLRNEINKKFGLTLTKKPFNIQLTYDIDIAYSYKCKGLVRNFGGAIRDISKGKIGLFFSRISTLLGLTKDPYDAFDFLFSLHNQYNFKPHYFTLLSEKNTDFDKNISPQSTEMQLLIKQLYNDGDVGIHPSYYTKDNNQLLAQEINTLTTITSQYITTSRQHYIRNFLPATYKQLMASGITEDYSMGYATEMGFRAGTSHSFLWYDFSNETITDLRIYPFCFMDTTARYDLGLDVNEAFNRLATMTNSVKQFGGNIYTIFHNFSLGNDGDWKGYKEHYEQWIALNTVTK